jgi:hypothetical protein
MAKSKFSGPFLPFPRWVLQYLGNDSIGKVVLLTILLYMDSDTQEVTTSYSHVAKLTGYSRRTIIRAVNRLVSSNVLIRKNRYGKHGNISNKYIVNFNNPTALVTTQTLPSDSPDTTGSDSPDTTPSVPSVTQSRITINKNNHNKNLSIKKEKKVNDITSGYAIDETLLAK